MLIGGYSQAFPAGTEKSATSQNGTTSVQESADWVDHLSKPGVGHKFLDLFVGKWEAKLHIWETPDNAPQFVTAEVERHWVPSLSRRDNT